MKKKINRYSRFKRKRKKTDLRRVFLIGLCLLALLLLYNTQKGDRAYPRDYRFAVEKYAEQNDLDANLVFALIKAESGFDPDAVSPKGAKGLMQLMPETAQWATAKMGIAYNAGKLTNSEYNIQIGTWYLKWLLLYYENDINKAIAAYNGGQGNVDQWLAEGTWDGSVKNAAQIPFPETADYLRRVMENYRNYKALYE